MADPMIHINLDPNILRLGPFLLAWHGVFSAIGIYVGVWLPGQLLTRDGTIDLERYYPVAFWAVAAGIVGARLLYVLEHASYFAQHPLAAFAINEGGISVFGAFIGGALVGALVAVRRGIPLGKFAGAASVGMALGQAIGRIGDIINGEHHGKPWDGPFSVVYTNPNTLGQRGVPVHLAVGYEMILDLLLFYALLKLYSRLPKAGMNFWVFFAGYGLIRFVDGFFRQDTIIAWGLSQAQLLGLLSLPVSAVMLLYLARSPRHDAQQPRVTEEPV